VHSWFIDEAEDGLGVGHGCDICDPISMMLWAVGGAFAE
jgi:hypothetical protein